MSDRKVQVITKDEAIKIRKSRQEVPAVYLDKINEFIRIQVGAGKEEIVVGRNMVKNDLQWNSLLKQLMAGGWKVREDCDQRDGTFATLKF